ncbi:MAG: hypothetical protein LBL21_04245 [Rickettsiales bacterium]|nr:hypothetical protein [Rickettsiales bacterium]
MAYYEPPKTDEELKEDYEEYAANIDEQNKKTRRLRARIKRDGLDTIEAIKQKFSKGSMTTEEYHDLMEERLSIDMTGTGKSLGIKPSLEEFIKQVRKDEKDSERTRKELAKGTSDPNFLINAARDSRRSRQLGE